MCVCIYYTLLNGWVLAELESTSSKLITSWPNVMQKNCKNNDGNPFIVFKERASLLISIYPRLISCLYLYIAL